MYNKIKSNSLFTTYYSEWIAMFKEGAVRNVTLNKYKMTLTWLKRLIPKLRLEDLDRIAYQQLINDYAESHERQITMDFHHQLKGAILECIFITLYRGLYCKCGKTLRSFKY